MERAQSAPPDQHGASSDSLSNYERGDNGYRDDKEQQHAHELPHWIFDVDEDDDPLDMRQNVSLLQELEIDLQQISTCVVWMFAAPWKALFGWAQAAGAHPIHRATNIDFWGPCTCVTLYGALLWFCNVRDVPWIYIIWTTGSVFNHLTSRAWSNASSTMLHLAIMGYSVSPLIPIAGLIVITHPPIWLANVLECAALIWAATAAYLSYYMVWRAAASAQHRPHVALLGPPILIMQLYMMSLLPIREWQLSPIDQ